MLKKKFFIITCCLLGSIYLLHNDQRAYDFVGNKFKQFFSQSYGCLLYGDVKSINLFDLSLTLKNLSVLPFNSCVRMCPSWQWQAQEMKLSFSWQALLHGIFDLEIALDSVKGNSYITDDGIAIIQEHIRKYIDGPSTSIPVNLKTLLFKNSVVHVHGDAPKIDCSIEWNSESKKNNNNFNSNIHLNNGFFEILDRSILSHLKGNISLNIDSSQQKYVVASKSNCKAQFEYLPEHKKECCIIGTWNREKGNFSIKNQDQSFETKEISLELKDAKLIAQTNMQLPFSYLVKMINPSLESAALNGACNLSISTAFAPGLQDLQGSLLVNDVGYNTVTLLDSLESHFQRTNKSWQGSALLARANSFQLSGDWHCEEQPFKGIINLANIQTNKLPFFSLWEIAQKNLTIAITIDDQAPITAHYRCDAENSKKEELMNIAGEITIKNNECMIQGNANKARYDGHLALQPNIRIKKLTYNDENNETLISLRAHHNNDDIIDGNLSFSLFQLLAKNFFNYNLQAQGILNINGAFNNNGLSVTTNLAHNSTIRLPQTYNAITQFNADIDLDVHNKKVILNSLECNLLKGSLRSINANLEFDEHFDFKYAYFPISFDSCLLNLKKDLFAAFSGTLSFERKANELPSLTGSIIIDRSQLNENLLSGSFQKNIFAYTGSMLDTDTSDMKCDITIETKNPIRVNTALLEATAKAKMHITNSVQDPHVSGVVEILSGSLQFPYRPLNIAKGSLYFMPHQLYDPIIELTAKNKIKKYTVSLQVNGSLDNHHISLESSPPLSEEQIIALLLVGSQEESLNVLMPALIAQNLKTLLFDSEQSPLKVAQYFKSWLKPFKNINLIPSFTDQTGRGGLRGAIEIDINDRTRALIQKNFNLTEDTRLELEYLVSDDISVRGIRDERKDVGGEVEMRWKFGG